MRALKSPGALLRAVRMEKNLCQADAAREIGLGRMQLSRHEQGKQKISHEFAARYAAFYDIAADDLTPADAPPPPSSETPGQRLLKLRQKMGLWQADAAKRIGITQSQMSRHERGKSAIGPLLAIRYARFFGVEPEFLVSAAKAKFPVTLLPAEATTPGERLRAIRMERGFSNLAECARLMGTNYITMTQHESGRRPITLQRATIYGAFFRVPAVYILTGETLAYAPQIDIVGLVESGGRIQDMPSRWNEVRQVPAAAGQNLDLVAYAVVGDDLYPVYYHGDVILATRPNGSVDAIEVNNRECVVTTVSGERLIRMVKSEADGRFSIFGPHGPPQLHIRLQHAQPVMQVNRGQLRALPRKLPRG